VWIQGEFNENRWLYWDVVTNQFWTVENILIVQADHLNFCEYFGLGEKNCEFGCHYILLTVKKNKKASVYDCSKFDVELHNMH
jgi:hypothetical protein